ncbi:MAG: sugar phosphate isomerase/epimerase [Planctomycetales bacterium]|nr:sugar phosphate isomerase/epimerase [Planctomycetales bacterium]
MNSYAFTRRSFLATTGCLAAGGLQRAAAQSLSTAPKFRYCLNTSTINGGMIPVRDQIKIASQAGYDSVELWTRDVDKFVNEGGSLIDLRNELKDLGLSVDSGIAFGAWIVDDDERRAAGIEQCKKDMDTLRALGGRRIAAPPVGATNEAGLALDAAGDRYHQLLEVGAARDVVPQLELWGFSKNLSRLEEVLHVASAAAHRDACVLLDVYHLYKGGSDFSNMGLVPGTKMHCLHMNDYPATPPRAEIADKDRIYPGDGIAPMGYILRTLARGGFSGTLSLELFNRDYWQQPAAEVAQVGLQKMKQVVAAAFSS